MAFGQVHGDEIKPGDDLAEFALEAEVAAAGAVFVGQQQGVACGVAVGVEDS